jgi:ornithine carbamoyltransferase
MNAQHLISIRDLAAVQVGEILGLAADVKRSPEKYAEALVDKKIGLFFEMPSARGRVSFDVASHELGAHSVFVGEADVRRRSSESLSDTARALSRYLDCIVVRLRSHADVVEMARGATVPVVNGFSDLLHPCQALADYFTLAEKKPDLKGRKIAFVGDGNYMCHSLLYGANKVGMDIAIATPQGFEPKAIIVKSAQREATQSGTNISVGQDPAAAVGGADAVYTDRWTPLGKEAEADQRKSIFQPFQVSGSLFGRAKPDAVFLHCLPAHRGEEVTSDVLDSPQSIVFDQAENRLHVQKALLLTLLR